MTHWSNMAHVYQAKTQKFSLLRWVRATNRVLAYATAYPHRDISFIMNVHVRWIDEKEDTACVSWARDFYKATKPFATGGVYVNFVSEGDDNIDGAYVLKTPMRLAEIKSKYDPKNILRI